jgi:hypothetical protein
MSVNSKDNETFSSVEIEMMIKIVKKEITAAEVLDTCEYLELRADQYYAAETTVFYLRYFQRLVWVSGNDYGLADQHSMSVSWYRGKLEVSSTNAELAKVTLDWEEPIDASSDSLSIAAAITSCVDVRVLSVDHDDDIVFVHVLK